MKAPFILFVSLLLPLGGALAAPVPTAPAYPRPLRELNTSYFPLQFEGEITPATWARRKQEIRDRVLLASGLFPLPTKTPLNAVVHGRIERDDYTIDRVFFESFPGHYVTGSLYLPKNLPAGRTMPGVLNPHGHWTNGRFMSNSPAVAAEQLAIGAERFESGAQSPLQARCVQLARMGCAAFIYDTLGTADSIQIAEHRSGRRPELNGREPGTFGLYSAMADLRLQSNLGLQTWNSIRALDFLLTVPGVDPQRVSCTGASGGGTQTMMLAAIDDRLATAFPCVMVSTAMQGGCTCENAPYLRIGQGNIDIAAAFAPKPMGMTAADDWTRELATKGFPELKAVWTKLGHPDHVLATFNTHWKHNYNHVSRTTMYGFMNRHFKLGFKEPVLERSFVVSTPEESMVWTGAHAKPSGERVGGAHEKALLRHWSEDSDRQLAGKKDLLAKAWTIMIGQPKPPKVDVTLPPAGPAERGTWSRRAGTVRDPRNQQEVPWVFFQPAARTWKGTTVVWVSDESPGAGTGAPTAAHQRLLDAGVAVAIPTLYLPGAKEQPMNPVRSTDPSRNEWRWAAAYTYGYNPSLVAHRVHDTMSVVAALQSHPEVKSSRVLIAGGSGAGVVAALALALMPGDVHGGVIDTEGFRFASLNDQWHPLFVPGAVKYGDVPGILSLSEPLKPIVLGEKGTPGGADAIASAVLRLVR